ncbi:Lrp/AsnC family transcriptional regulator [Pseudonocardia spinosispora]|uniref:Lrp/AsnC family transcriptional regulator n=1 Tax=Pseudonocardia spinosispora TaxID=103441 RepID=UPI000403829D|nr:AsnC family transcriptional regulator [Pseudonocardia spinosispora]
MQLLTETDLELVDAVQINPRASWATIGATLGISAVTAARRWNAMVEAGVAWSSSTVGIDRVRGAVVELDCRPGTTEAVAAALSEQPDVLTVGWTTGEFSLYALTVAASVEALTGTLLGTFADLDVRRQCSHVYWRVFGGAQWRLSVLNPSQTQQVRESPVAPLRRSAVDDDDRRLFLALAHDARRSYAGLAEELGTTPSAVRRRLERMRRRGELSFRADIARPLAGWHLAALLWLVVPDADLDAIGRVLGGWTETRFCAAVHSRTNLVLVVSLRTVDHLEEIIERLNRVQPDVTVADRRIVLRPIKVHGRILDEGGRSHRVVPLDPWAGQNAKKAWPESRRES